MNKIEQTFRNIEKNLKRTSIARLGGFRPPQNPTISWFGGQGVGSFGEVLPQYQGKNMFVLLQVNVTELPYAPESLNDTKLLVVFLNREQIPFNRKHGEGWLIKEYRSLEGLQPLPASNDKEMVRPFPIHWELSESDAPCWETACNIIDMKAINESEVASDLFFEKYTNYSGTKIGGWPTEIQHFVGNEENEFVFQIGSEGKSNWQWLDGGVGYFFKDRNDEWVFECQFY